MEDMLLSAIEVCFHKNGYMRALQPITARQHFEKDLRNDSLLLPSQHRNAVHAWAFF